jgi:hypothetical protein
MDEEQESYLAILPQILLTKSFDVLVLKGSSKAAFFNYIVQLQLNRSFT